MCSVLISIIFICLKKVFGIIECGPGNYRVGKPPLLNPRLPRIENPIPLVNPPLPPIPRPPIPRIPREAHAGPPDPPRPFPPSPLFFALGDFGRRFSISGVSPTRYSVGELLKYELYVSLEKFELERSGPTVNQPRKRTKCSNH